MHEKIKKIQNRYIYIHKIILIVYNQLRVETWLKEFYEKTIEGYDSFSKVKKFHFFGLLIDGSRLDENGDLIFYTNWQLPQLKIEI